MIETVNLADVTVTARLAEATVGVTAVAECRGLLDAFPVSEVAGRGPHLDLRIGVNPTGLDSPEFCNLDSSQHFRRGREHLWMAPTPQQLQRLFFDEDRAELILNSRSLTDGAIRARPSVDSISAWATAHNIFPLHASAVVLGSDALIFVGDGGRGKTTTALALASSGWSFLADDRCFLSSDEGGLSVSGLYQTAILTPAIAERFPEFLGHKLGETHEGKIACELPKTVTLAKSARIRGVVAVSHGRGEAYRLERLGYRDALSTWQQTLIPAIQALGPTKEILSVLARAVRALPVWSFTLGWNFDRIDTALRQHVDEIRELKQ
jgi:hypothetical protein